MNVSSRLAWIVLGLLIVLGLPLHACMPLWPDPELFDSGARLVLRGGVLYRDLFYFAPPGMIFAHAGVRSLAGWSSAALRLADFAVVAAAVAILTGFVLPPPRHPGWRPWTACLMIFFYLNTTETCHCQPDVWMLLPASAALALRVRQAGRLLGPAGGAFAIARGALVEGACWGLAVLFKPTVALPALACWLLTVVWGRGSGRRLAADFVGLLLGGLLVGGAVLGWLVFSGNWPYFLRTVLSRWSQDYALQYGPWTARAVQSIVNPWPWALVNLAALLLAIYEVKRSLWAVKPEEPGSSPGLALPLLGACYLLWFYQANFVQLQVTYHQVPAVLLALTLVAGRAGALERQRGWVVVLAGLAVWAAFFHPVLRPARLAQWGRCWTEGATPAVKDALALSPRSPSLPTHVDLRRVADFLRPQGLRDRELTCFTTATLPLYTELDLTPSTRFPQLGTALELLPSSHADIVREVNASPHRFVVWDVRAFGVPPEQERGPVQVPAAMADEFRFFRDPVVLRSGRYVVHKVRPPGSVAGPADAGGPVAIPAASPP